MSVPLSEEEMENKVCHYCKDIIGMRRGYRSKEKYRSTSLVKTVVFAALFFVSYHNKYNHLFQAIVKSLPALSLAREIKAAQSHVPIRKDKQPKE